MLSSNKENTNSHKNVYLVAKLKTVTTAFQFQPSNFIIIYICSYNSFPFYPCLFFFLHVSIQYKGGLFAQVFSTERIINYSSYADEGKLNQL